MAIPFDTLFEEAKCYLCLGISQGEAMELALLNRIASAGSSGSECLVYRALLTQTGANAPVVTVLQNTIGEIVWIRDDVGVYLGNLTSAFPLSSTMAFINGNNVGGGFNYTINVASDSQIQITTYTLNAGVYDPTDGIMTNTAVEILVCS